MTVNAIRPSAAARALGIEPTAIRRIHARANVHWRVEAPSGAFVLRLYRQDASVAAIRFEHAVLAHLDSRGWPVAAAVADPVEVDGRWWALFPRLRGPAPRHWADGDERHRWRGELLAKLHADTAELTRALGQRDGWHRCDEAAVVTPEHIALLARLRRLDRPRSVGLERHARTIAEGVRFLQAGTMLHVVVHGDFVPWNLMVRGRELVGLLDFDLTHLDSRAADVAWASWGGTAPAVIDGYSSVAPLTEEEEAALPLLWRAAWLAVAWASLAKNTDRVDRSLDQALEKLARPWGSRDAVS
ncbi:MAG TPA: phosphotransferase [Acidimicrobiales bacterium]